MIRKAVFIASLIAAHLIAAPALAQPGPGGDAARRTDTPSGLPVPRFVSLKYDKTHCRTGPSFAHPVAVIYLKTGLPVEIVAETTDHWRKLRDRAGAQCWAHQTTLKAVSHVLTVDETVLLARPAGGAPSRARLAAGVLARLEREKDGWVYVSVSGLKGWAPDSAFWGVSR